MKDMTEVKARLKVELIHWFPKQCENVNDDYYLYYLPTTEHHNSRLIIWKGVPANGDYRLVTAERIRKDQTVEGNFNRILLTGYLNRLPILDS